MTSQPIHDINPLMLSDEFPFNLFRPQSEGTVLFHPHWHEKHMEIIMMAEGQAEFHIGGRSYAAVPGDIYFMPEGQIHGGYLQGAVPDYYTILFNRFALSGTAPNGLLDAPILGKSLALPDRLRPDDPHYEGLAQTIRSIVGEFAERQQSYEIVIRSYLHILLARLSRAYAAEDFPAYGTAPGMRHAEQLKHVMMYVDLHYAEKIPVEHAAKLANMSTYHFCRTFKKAAGRTFTEFLNAYRIAKAAELLVQTDSPITRIAERTGFGTVNYFDELFKKYKGVSPSQFRKNDGKRQ
ncbi:AraC family transcriptional regulator [Paenibacillus sp. MBLB4367]|uniref:helix-turn-helix transcriptional regulator n=1 Tax=Paenibacillus sp. MBLB4367 TaxID=3384767 RepID=UPI0039081014